MGCGVHAILQKKGEDEQYKTILWDCIDLPSSLAREFNEYISGMRISGYPEDLAKNMDSDGYYSEGDQKFWLGEHSRGHLFLADLLEADSEECKYADPFSVHRVNSTITIEFPEDDFWSFDSLLLSLQRAWRVMFSDAEYGPRDRYRLVIGFDS